MNCTVRFRPAPIQEARTPGRDEPCASVSKTETLSNDAQGASLPIRDVSAERLQSTNKKRHCFASWSWTSFAWINLTKGIACLIIFNVSPAMAISDHAEEMTGLISRIESKFREAENSGATDPDKLKYVPDQVVVNDNASMNLRNEITRLDIAARVNLKKQEQSLLDEPHTPGESALFIVAIEDSEKYRPATWEQTYARLLNDKIPCVRELALYALMRPFNPAGPLPITPMLHKEIASRIHDSDNNVRIFALNLAEKMKDPKLEKEILDQVAGAHEHYLLHAAVRAACASKLKVEAMNILADRLTDGETIHFLNELTRSCINHSEGGGWLLKDTPVSALQLKLAWKRFIQENESQLRDGMIFELDDPRLSRELLPENYILYGEKTRG